MFPFESARGALLHLLAIGGMMLPFAAPVHSDPSGWPGNRMGSDVYQTGGPVDFAANFFSFKTNANITYMAFEAIHAGTSNKYVDGTHEIFLVSPEDKATMAAIQTAFATGSKFVIQYKKQVLLDRPVMEVMSFFVLK